MEIEQVFRDLGNKVIEYKGLETFPKPEHCSSVTLTSDEMTSVCPITSQPDWYTVTVRYSPNEKCIESKSFKLFIQSFREKGMFCEKLADIILKEVVCAISPHTCIVSLVQKPRGGVSIISTSIYGQE